MLACSEREGRRFESCHPDQFMRFFEQGTESCRVAQINPFSKEISFEYGVAMPLSPLVRRFVAKNAGPLTFKGTNVYIIGHGDVAVLDPGPAGEAHMEALLGALPGENISKIFLTHTHKDHCGGLVRLQELTGASTYGFRAGEAIRGVYRPGTDLASGELATDFADISFRPDRSLVDGDEVCGQGWILRAVHTPGHAPDHVCYSLVEERALFTGDHIMPWSTSVIAPPEGNMQEYMASLSKLSDRDDEIYLPGHGGRVRKPKRLLRAYILHRQWREQSIIKALGEGHERVDDLMAILYRDIEEELKPAARLSVLAHLEFLETKGKAQRCDGQGLEGRFVLVKKHRHPGTGL